MLNILVATRCPIRKGNEKRWEEVWIDGWKIMHGPAHRGALYGKLAYRIDCPELYFTWGEWESVEVFDQITQGPDIARHRDEMAEMLSEPITRHWYEVVCIGGARDSRMRLSHAVTLDVYVHPGKERLWEELWQDLWRDVKPHQGWIVGKLMRDINDPQHYLNIGEWESIEAWEEVVRRPEMAPGLEFMEKKVFARPAIREWWEVVAEG